jgi:hypothetical protein
MLLFWRPCEIKEEWDLMYFLKLVEGKVIANTDLRDSETLPI